MKILLSYLYKLIEWIFNSLSYKNLIIYIGQVSTYAAYFVNGKVEKEFFVSSNNMKQVLNAIQSLPQFYKLTVVYDNENVVVHHNSFSNVNFSEEKVIKVMRNNLPKDALLWSRSEIGGKMEIYNKEFAHMNTAVLDFHHFEDIASSFDTTEILEGIYFSSFIIVRLLEKLDIKLKNKFLIAINITHTTGISILAIENGIIVLRKIVPLEPGRSSEYIYGQCKHAIESILLTFKANIDELSLESQSIWMLSKKYIDVFQYVQENDVEGTSSKIMPEITEIDCVERYLSAFLIANQNSIKHGKNSIIHSLDFAKKLKFFVYVVLGGILSAFIFMCGLLFIEIIKQQSQIKALKHDNEVISEEYNNIVNNLGFNITQVNSAIKLHSIMENISHENKIDFNVIDQVRDLSCRIHQLDWKHKCNNTIKKSCYNFNCCFDSKMIYDCNSKGNNKLKDILENRILGYEVTVSPKQTQFNNEKCRIAFTCQKK